VWQAIALGLLILLSRLPLLGHGYGSDADAWRAIQAGQHLLDTGHYLPSRPPGYPLPEYVLALLLQCRIATPWVVGFISAVLSGVAACLMALVVAPFGGWWRAAAAAVALAFTPVVFVASLGGMDSIWGLTFFLAATLCVLRSRWPWAAFWLGLAAASRPTYAFAFLPLAWAGLQAEGLSLRTGAAWRRLVPLALLSGGITLAFFVPAIRELGWRILSAPRPGTGTQTPAWLIYNSTMLLFGLCGTVAVALAVMAACWPKHDAAAANTGRQPWPLTGWAWLLIGLYAVEFLLLPDEASYLMPALLGIYTLLAHYSSRRMLAVLVLAMVASGFLFSVARDKGGRPGLVAAGPVLREIDLERRRDCVARLVKDHLARAPRNERVIVAEYRPQVMVEVGAGLADRVLYAVEQRSDGQWQDEEAGPLASGLHFTVLDRAVVQQGWAKHLPEGSFSVLDTNSRCP
jgi:hypothetical protein